MCFQAGLLLYALPAVKKLKPQRMRSRRPEAVECAVFRAELQRMRIYCPINLWFTGG